MKKRTTIKIIFCKKLLTRNFLKKIYLMNTFFTIFYEDFLTTIFLERIVLTHPFLMNFLMRNFDKNILEEHFFFAENVFQPFFDNKNFDDKFFTTTLMRSFLKRTSDKKILDGKSKR